MKKNVKKIGILICLFFALCIAQPINAVKPSLPLAQTTTEFEARIINIYPNPDKNNEISNLGNYVIEIKPLAGPYKNKRLKAFGVDKPIPTAKTYGIGDKILATVVTYPDKTTQVYVLDYVRKDGLYLLFVIFAILALITARWRGVWSLIGMVYTFFIIFKIILPQIILGINPVFVAIVGACLIIPVTYYVSHGINLKTHAAVLGTLISLIVTGILSYVFVELTYLTGLASEESTFLAIYKPIHMKGLLMAGIIIGLLGILDDITISQAAIVTKLKEANSRYTFWDLYTKAIDIGRDHIGSVINTLVLVYAGASLPLLLLFITNNQSYSTVINYEMIAEEVVRTLTASIGLIMAVPITTAIAAFFVNNTISKR